MALARETTKAGVHVDLHVAVGEEASRLLNEAGYPLFTSATVARAPCGPWPTIASCASVCCANRNRPRRSRRTAGSPATLLGSRRLRIVRVAGAAAAGGLWHFRRRSGETCALGRRSRSGGTRCRRTRSRSRSSPRTYRTRPKPVASRSILPAQMRRRRLRTRARERQETCAGGAHRRRAGAADGGARARSHSRRQPRPDSGAHC